MKKRPEIPTDARASDLVGSSENSTWVVGRNCVYRDDSVADYRVSIKTPSGWKSYGHFYDLETATYVANIAILVERCEEKYALNKGIGTKNIEELAHWRMQSRNADLERVARARYEEVQAALKALKEEELVRAQLKTEMYSQRVKAHDHHYSELVRIKEEKTKMILGLNNHDLVNYIRSTSVRDPFYEVAMKEAKRRFRNLGLPSAT